MNELKVIPDDIFKDRIRFPMKGSMICDCGILHENILLYPYAYDAENNEVIYASYCSNCRELMYTRD